MDKQYAGIGEIVEPAKVTRASGPTVNIGQPSLDTKDTGGVLEQPQYASSPIGRQIPVSLNYDGGINETASTENLSAKFKNPEVKQEVPQKGQNQYE